MKKKLIVILTICCMLFACLGVIGCGEISNNGNGGNATNAQIMAIYNSYLLNAQEQGVSPLSYEDWLATIKGEKGDKGDQGEQGIQGEKGDKGDQGVGIADMYISNDGCLMVKYTNSNEYVNIGKVVPSEPEEEGNGLEFCISDDRTGYAVSSLGNYIGNNVIIPSTYKGAPVVEIYKNAFKGYKIVSITLPDTITTIGNSAFYDCRSLTSVIIGNSVTNIGDGAFSGCTSLTSIVIPNGVTSIGDSAFSGCDSLTSIVIPNSVTSIGDSAFYGCDLLTSVEIGDSATSIGNSAFYNCSSLTSVEMGNSVTSIGNYSFSYCYSLTSIVIPNSVTSIGYEAFSSCSSLTSVEIGNSVTSIGNSAFSGCTSLTYNIKCGLKYLGNSTNKYLYLADTESTSITTATIDSNCRVIGFATFSNCDSLTSVEIPDSIISIGGHAFSDCSSLTSIVIPDSVTSIGGYAFSYCSKLISIKYRGTKEQWQKISKGSYWSHNTGNFTITYEYKGE